MAPHGLIRTPNDHPTTAQGPPGVVGVHQEIAIFQRTHASLNMAKSSPVGPHRGVDRKKKWSGTCVRIDAQWRREANQILPSTMQPGPKQRSRANEHHQEGQIGATMGLCTLLFSLSDHPTTAKGPHGLSEVTLKSQFFSHPILAYKWLRPHRWGPNPSFGESNQKRA